jgi:hypothetical protein
MAQRQFRSDDTDKWPDKFGNGSVDVTKTTTETASLNNAGCSGASGQKSLTLDIASGFSNGDYVVIHQTRGTGAGTWELNKIAAGAGSTSLTMAYNLINTYTDSGISQAQIVGFIKSKNFSVNNGITVTVPAWDGNKGGIYPVLANGDITITGNILCTGKGFLGSTVHPFADGWPGEGYPGLSTNASQLSNGNGGGGGKQGTGGGGGGGYATTGSNGGGTNPGSAGDTIGIVNLTTTFFGGGGGDAGHQGGYGGNGGGFILLIGKTITITGSVINNGNVGGNGAAGSGGGGGGGAGGAVLLKAKIITLGSNLITSSGANGGSPSGGGGAGGNSSNGCIHADYAVSISGTTTPMIDTTNDVTIMDNVGAAILSII